MGLLGFLWVFFVFFEFSLGFLWIFSGFSIGFLLGFSRVAASSCSIFRQLESSLSKKGLKK